ncbi:MAG: DUF6498-containing protein [Chitinophagaceae bacterium]
MFKRNIQSSDYFLIIANLVPVIGVLAWGWSPTEVFIVYCLETIIIGLLTLVKMIIVNIARRQENRSAAGVRGTIPIIGLLLFFIFHYGMFVAVQMGIFFNVSGIASKSNIGFLSFIYKWPSLLSHDSFIMLMAFFFCYVLQMLVDFILNQKYRSASLLGIMFAPYVRVFVQQFTVIFGSIFLSFGAGKIFIIIFAFIKIVFEVLLDFNKLYNWESFTKGFQSD